MTYGYDFHHTEMNEVHMYKIKLITGSGETDEEMQLAHDFLHSGGITCFNWCDK